MSVIAASSIDWTNVIVAFIVGLPAIIAALYSARIHAKIKTPSGKAIGEVVEYAHDTTIANNLLLTQGNGPTKPLSHGAAHDVAQEPPRAPDETPPTAGGS